MLLTAKVCDIPMKTQFLQGPLVDYAHWAPTAPTVENLLIVLALQLIFKLQAIVSQQLPKVKSSQVGAVGQNNLDEFP